MWMLSPALVCGTFSGSVEGSDDQNSLQLGRPVPELGPAAAGGGALEVFGPLGFPYISWETTEVGSVWWIKLRPGPRPDLLFWMNDILKTSQLNR